MRRTPDDILDEWLVLRCQTGDAQALNVLAQRWYGRLQRHAYRLTGETDAATEVVQEAWVAIIRSIHRVKDPALFRAWMYRIVSNKAADWVRSQQRRRRYLTATNGQEVSKTNPDPAETQDIRIVRAALKHLSKEQRRVLTLYYLDGLSVREIAVALSIPVGTVKSRLHHARNHLRTMLEEAP